MVIEKSREQVPVWEVFQSRQEGFPALFEAVWALYFKENTSHKERGFMVRFFVQCFQSLENAMVRGVCLQQVALPLWQHLSRARLEIEMRSAPQLEKKWKSMVKKMKKGDAQAKMHLPPLLDHFFKTLSSVQAQVCMQQRARADSVCERRIAVEVLSTWFTYVCMYVCMYV